MYKFFALFALAAGALAPTPAWAAASGQALPVQDPALVVAEVEKFLQSQASNYPGSVHINIDAPRIARQTACEQFPAFLPTGSRPRSPRTVGVRCMAPEPWPTTVQASPP